jgi:hypothetical protein
MESVLINLGFIWTVLFPTKEPSMAWRLDKTIFKIVFIGTYFNLTVIGV